MNTMEVGKAFGGSKCQHLLELLIDFFYIVGESMINHRPGLSVGKMHRFAWWTCLWKAMFKIVVLLNVLFSAFS